MEIAVRSAFELDCDSWLGELGVINRSSCVRDNEQSTLGDSITGLGRHQDRRSEDWRRNFCHRCAHISDLGDRSNSETW